MGWGLGVAGGGGGEGGGGVDSRLPLVSAGNKPKCIITIILTVVPRAALHVRLGRAQVYFGATDIHYIRSTFCGVSIFIYVYVFVYMCTVYMGCMYVYIRAGYLLKRKALGGSRSTTFSPV